MNVLITTYVPESVGKYLVEAIPEYFNKSFELSINLDDITDESPQNEQYAHYKLQHEVDNLRRDIAHMLKDNGLSLKHVKGERGSREYIEIYKEDSHED